MGFFEKIANSAKGVHQEKGGSGVAPTYDAPVTGNNQAMLVMANDGVNICATACACCWDTKLPGTYAERKTYIGKRAATGHTSILEHANLVFYMYCAIDETIALIDFLSTNHFLWTRAKGASDGGTHLLFGGSWRAFSDLYLHITRHEMEANSVYRKITQAVLTYIPKEAMMDLIKLGVFSEEDFDAYQMDMDQLTKAYSKVRNYRLDPEINIINLDDIDVLVNNLRDYCREPWVFTYADMLPFCTCTIEFNGMSRIITQQLVRHRNAITQESMRYVDKTKSFFNPPSKFKPEKYDPKRLYSFQFGGKEFKMNLQSLGDAINAIYGQLKDKAKYGTAALVSEDARGFLCCNTQCGQIFITFTLYNLIKFLQLREDPHAQVEIRDYAKRIGMWFRPELIAGLNVNQVYPFAALEPLMVMGTGNPFAQPIAPFQFVGTQVVGEDDNEVGEAMSEEEYAKLVGESIKHADAHPEEVDPSEPVEVLPEEKRSIPWDSQGMR